MALFGSNKSSSKPVTIATDASANAGTDSIALSQTQTQQGKGNMSTLTEGGGLSLQGTRMGGDLAYDFQGEGSIRAGGALDARNYSAGGGDGSLIATGDARIHVESLSDDVALGSIAGMRDISAAFLGSARDTQLAFMQNTKDMQALTYRENADVRSAANIANETNAALAGQLAALAVDNVAFSKRDPDNQLIETLAKYGTYIAAGVAVLVALFLFRKK